MKISAWFRELFLASSDNTLIQLFRYGFVGGVAFVADFSVLWLLTDVAGIHYMVSATLSFVLGLAVNYLLSTCWVFRKGKIGNRWLEFLAFALIGLVGLGLNVLIMWLFTDAFHVYYLLSKIISTVLVFLWNFFARKLLLFRR